MVPAHFIFAHSLLESCREIKLFDAFILSTANMASTSCLCQSFFINLESKQTYLGKEVLNWGVREETQYQQIFCIIIHAHCYLLENSRCALPDILDAHHPLIVVLVLMI